MCGEFEGAYKRKDLLRNPQFHIAQFASAIGDPRVWQTAKTEGKPVSWLRINQEGNFTNPREMSPEAQEKVLRLAMRIEGVKRITIESRPQYITQTAVSSLAEWFSGSDVELEVGMGLETEDEVVRNVCINKKGTNGQFSAAIQLLRDNGILSLAYVLLKPPFLTEIEAIDEATAAAHFAHQIGFSRISLEPMSVHPYSLVDVLTRTGDYKVPYLWSVAQVVQNCAAVSSSLGVGGIGYYPVPREYSNNHCPDEENCTRAFNEAIVEYNHSRRVSVFGKLACQCRHAWEDECSSDAPPLRQRIHEQLTRAEELIPAYSAGQTQASTATRNQRLLACWTQGVDSQNLQR